MMNFTIPYLPERSAKPRESGIAMVMDKGLSVREAENLIDSSCHLIDFLKLGFGTSIATGRVKDKIKVYQDAGINVYLGGTLLEAFIVRGLFDEYRKLIDDLGVKAVEVSDGSILLDSQKKCEYISILSKDRIVLSEVGYKDAGLEIEPESWLKKMQEELDAGSYKVIGEARESGTVGLYQANGSANTALINLITNNIQAEKIIWEAPKKSQQVWFIKHFGPEVNLGNIAPEEIIPLETLRLGLRGDTFFDVLPDEFQSWKL